MTSVPLGVRTLGAGLPELGARPCSLDSADSPGTEAKAQNYY